MVDALRAAVDNLSRETQEFTATSIERRRTTPVKAFVGLAALLGIGAFGAWQYWGHDRSQVPPGNGHAQAEPSAVKEPATPATPETPPPMPVVEKPADKPTINPAEAAAKAQVARGEELFKKGSVDEALVELTKAIAESPKPLADAYLWRGTCYLQKQDYAQAEKDLSQAIDLNPKDLRAYSRRGLAWFNQDKLEPAIADFTAAIKLEPGATDYLNRGRAYWNLYKYNEAIADFTAAIALNPDPKEAAEAYFERAKVRSVRDYAEAAADFAEALARNDKDPEIKAQYAWLLATAPDDKVRNGDQAVQLAKKACELSESKEPAYLDILAAAYAEAGQWDDAIKSAKDAIEKAKLEEFDMSVIDDYASRLKLYEKHEPYRQVR
jgi:tetratricopeptide (TPR) repeat protein